MLTRLRHGWTGLLALLSLADPRRRVLWTGMRAYVRGLPAALAQPLPAMLAAHTPATVDLALPPSAVRRLADAAALFERRSPLGVCLRRSLVRYHYLRRAGVPLVVNFGARFKDKSPDRDVTGHAWVTLAGEPYFEDGENYQGFVVMMRYPEG
jgi:hypothetical protein